MDVFDAMWTTRAMRRLDAAATVPAAAMHRIVEAATKAATASNSQTVRWIVVRDTAGRTELGRIYAECWKQVSAFYDSRPVDEALDGDIRRSAGYLGEHMGDAPVIVVPVAPGPAGSAAASVYPGVQNLMLAARALGLGTTLTTLASLREDEVRAALGYPEDHTSYALIAVGVPLGRWGEAKRRPVEEVAFADRWGASFAGSN